MAPVKRTPCALGVFAAIAAAAGCDYRVFHDLEKDAPTVVNKLEGGGRAGVYGTVLSSFHGTIEDESMSVLLVSGGADSTVGVYRIWWRGGLRAADAPFDRFCDDNSAEEDCLEGHGAAVAGVTVWGEEEMCVAFTEPGAERVHFECPSKVNVPSVTGEGEEYGASMAALAGFEGGALIVGAPGASTLHFVSGTTSTPIELLDEVADVATRLGERLSAMPMDGDEYLVAATGDGSVVVFALSIEDDEPVASVRACLEAGSEDKPPAIVFGNLDEDDVPDLIVGDESDELLAIYYGADLPEDEGCGDWAEDPVLVACPEDVSTTGCDHGRFGVSVGVGDVDGDGDDDVIAGTPNADAKGKSRSGGVFVFPTDDGAPVTDHARFLALSTPEADANLGAAVTSVHVGDDGDRVRDEIVAGSPGNDTTAIFLCSGLSGDDTDVGVRCQPE